MLIFESQQLPLEQLVTLKEDLDPAYAQFRDQTRFWIQRVAVPLLMVIGLFGNSITVIIMTRRRMRSTTNMYLAALAFVDMLYLVLTFLLGLSHYPNMTGYKYYVYWKLRPFLMMLTDACSNTSVWLTVTFTIERYIAVKFPIKGKVWCTEARAKMLIIFVFALGILFAAPVPFEWEVVEKRVATKASETDYSSNVMQQTLTGLDNLKNESRRIDTSEVIQETYNTSTESDVILTLENTDFGRNETYKTIYYWSTAVIFYFIPLFSLMLFNGFLIKSVHHSRKERTRMTRRVVTSYTYASPSCCLPPSSSEAKQLLNSKLLDQEDLKSCSNDGSGSGLTVEDRDHMPKYVLKSPSHSRNYRGSSAEESSIPNNSGQSSPLISRNSLEKEKEFCPPNGPSNNKDHSRTHSRVIDENNGPDICGYERTCSPDFEAEVPNQVHEKISSAQSVTKGTKAAISANGLGSRSEAQAHLDSKSPNKPGSQSNGDSRSQDKQSQSSPLLSEQSHRGTKIGSGTSEGSSPTNKKSSRPHNVQGSGQQTIIPASTQERRITIMLIAVVILFLFCQIPSAAMLLYASVREIVPNTNEHALVLAFGNIFNFLMAINAAGNFILYSLLSKKYRRTFVIIFCCCLGTKNIQKATNRMTSVRFDTSNNIHRGQSSFYHSANSSDKARKDTLV